MASHHWQIDVFSVSTPHAQQDILRILDAADGITATGVDLGSGRFLAVECPDPAAAAAAEGIIASMDPDAQLTYTSVSVAPSQSAEQEPA